MLARHNLPRFIVKQGQIHVNSIYVVTANRNAWHAVADLRAKYAEIGATGSGMVSLYAGEATLYAEPTADQTTIQFSHKEGWTYSFSVGRYSLEIFAIRAGKSKAMQIWTDDGDEQ